MSGDADGEERGAGPATAEQLHASWLAERRFTPDALRHYGIGGERTLANVLRQRDRFAASFALCPLGATVGCAAEDGQGGSTSSSLTSSARSATAAAAADDEEGKAGAATHAGTSVKADTRADDALLATLLYGDDAAGDGGGDRGDVPAEVHESWLALRHSAEWAHTVCGVVTVRSWASEAERQAIRRQLRLAAFLGLHAVQVPLPTTTTTSSMSATHDSTSCTSTPLEAVQLDAETGAMEETSLPGGPAAVLRKAMRPMALAASATMATSALSASMAAEVDPRRRTTALLCHAADILLAFIQEYPQMKIWVRCDACVPAHRLHFHALRQAILYGHTVEVRHDTNEVSHVINEITAGRTAVRWEAMMSLAPLLYFSQDTAPHHIDSYHAGEDNNNNNNNSIAAGEEDDVAAASGMFATTATTGAGSKTRVSSEWLGEDVAAFELPPVELLQRCLQPWVAVAAEAGDDGSARRSAAAAGAMQRPAMAGAAPAEASTTSRASSHGEGSSTTTTATTTTTANATQASSWCTSASSLPSQLWRAAPSTHVPAEEEQSGGHERPRSCVIELPSDLLPLQAARWGGYYPARVSLVTFIVELLRRRAAPILGDFFFDAYALLNACVHRCVADGGRDAFRDYEDALQLPLQPLAHQLSSTVYEVFERDEAKYRAYRRAFALYVRDWAAGPRGQRHAVQNRDWLRRACASQQHAASAVRDDAESEAAGREERDTMYLVLLGAGRGPILDECLAVASDAGLRLRVFAIEKNAPASAFVRLRWQRDAVWRQQAAMYGHTLDVICGDARGLYECHTRHELPADFGVCDVVVSELLGSFADNELSPECLELFHEQLLRVQRARGVAANAHLVSLPQNYTAWLAPVHSTRLEQMVAEAARRGLTVRPDYCPNAYTALFHSMFVCNVCRAVQLAPAQPCWSFTHFRSLQRERPTGPTPPLAGSFLGGVLRPASLAGSVAAAAAAAAPPAVTATTPQGKNTANTAAVRADSLADMERNATLQFDIAPQGRCSGFAGFFTCLLYRSSSNTTTQDAVTLSTEATSRTPDLYSWFPCLFALDPVLVRNVVGTVSQSSSKSATVPLVLHMQRKVSVQAKRVWYSWSIQYGHSSGKQTLMNEGGWAASMML